MRTRRARVSVRVAVDLLDYDEGERWIPGTTAQLEIEQVATCDAEDRFMDRTIERLAMDVVNQATEQTSAISPFTTKEPSA